MLFNLNPKVLQIFVILLITKFSSTSANQLATSQNECTKRSPGSFGQDGPSHESLSRPRRSPALDEAVSASRHSLSSLVDSHQLEAFEGLVIPVVRGQEGKRKLDFGDDTSSSEQQPFLATLYRPRHSVDQSQLPPPMPYQEPPGSEAAAHKQVVDDEPWYAPSLKSSPPQPPPLVSKQRPQTEPEAVDMSKEAPDSFESLVQDEVPLGENQAASSYEHPAAFHKQLSYQLAPKVSEIRIGFGHVQEPIQVPEAEPDTKPADLNTAAGHFYGNKDYYKKKIVVVKKKKKKVYIVKKKKKKRKKKSHHYGGHYGGHHGHYDHGHYYMYAKVPKKKSWEHGHKKGNKKHWIERHEKGHKNRFKTHVKWYDAKGKGKGHHVWDYNHHDKKKKKHY